MLFISSYKLFSFLTHFQQMLHFRRCRSGTLVENEFRYLHFCPDFFSYAGRRHDMEAKVNFKINDVTNWNTNNYNKYIARYISQKVKAIRQ